MSIPSRVTCAIAGGGPAGMMLGLLLARAGVSVLVLEKHADFLRDFRGDTVHPSTLDNISELGLLDQFLALPHQKINQVHINVGNERIQVGDFAYTPTRCHFIALMPQWDFLNFLAGAGAKYPDFHLRMQAKVTDLIEEGGRITGLHIETPEGAATVHADLVIGADGRHSLVREKAGLKVKNLGAPIDALWMRLSKQPGDPAQLQGYMNFGRLLAMIDRGDYWQCAYLIRKGGFAAIRQRGLDALKADIIKLVPYLQDRLHELASWDNIKLLSVAVDRLEQWWKPGLLCIGDCAHAMSPIGGIGINLAIQDAVAAANILAKPLREGKLSVRDLQAVQDRRLFPTRATQAMQVVVQNRLFGRIIGNERPMRAPWIVKQFNRFPMLRRIPARLLGVGFRPEHLRAI